MMHTNHHYNKHLKEYARNHRTHSVSMGEKHLWKELLRKRGLGKRFLRQRAIDSYIVDFFCPELKLIIEVDGNSHFSKGIYDRIRQNRLENLGYKVLRFSEGQVLNEIEEVRSSISHAIQCLEMSPP